MAMSEISKRIAVYPVEFVIRDVIATNNAITAWKNRYWPKEI
jgi:hypothetical protein